ncbi:hypothetical protein CPB84DRAFT_1851468 [Gymnopilus junonius]|uniref:Uncharacterized protein n=1 Tax=Gymnopilus junonius TaxID=109634 RepID=A0A9P5NCF3_GYMJU|nr:hypothetical protein CPB84DRAFT_1851468 [Gymnopilus junonius]
MLLEKTPSHLVLIFPSTSSSQSADLALIQGLISTSLIQVIAIVEGQGPYPKNVQSVKYLTDFNSVAQKAYSINSHTVYVTIRPDGIIGAYNFRLEGIVEYFTWLGGYFPGSKGVGVLCHFYQGPYPEAKAANVRSYASIVIELWGTNAPSVNGSVSSLDSVSNTPIIGPSILPSEPPTVIYSINEYFT